MARGLALCFTVVMSSDIDSRLGLCENAFATSSNGVTIDPFLRAVSLVGELWYQGPFMCAPSARRRTGSPWTPGAYYPVDDGSSMNPSRYPSGSTMTILKVPHGIISGSTSARTLPLILSHMA